MIEIVFGESACGSLKIAQTYGKGKYRGSAVSIFMRHEDGSVPSSDEMKKAQLQAQEQERIAWENAIPLGGKSSDVCFVYVSAGKMQLSAFHLPVFSNNLWIIGSLSIAFVFFILLYGVYYIAARISYRRQ